MDPMKGKVDFSADKQGGGWSHGSMQCNGTTSVQTEEHTTETCTIRFTYYPCIALYNQADIKVLFLSSFTHYYALHPLIGRHNHSANSVAGDEAQLRAMFQKHVACGGKTIVHVRNWSLRASSKRKGTASEIKSCEF